MRIYSVEVVLPNGIKAMYRNGGLDATLRLLRGEGANITMDHVWALASLSYGLSYAFKSRRVQYTVSCTKYICEPDG